MFITDIRLEILDPGSSLVYRLNISPYLPILTKPVISGLYLLQSDFFP